MIPTEVIKLVLIIYSVCVILNVALAWMPLRRSCVAAIKQTTCVMWFYCLMLYFGK